MLESSSMPRCDSARLITNREVRCFHVGTYVVNNYLVKEVTGMRINGSVALITGGGRGIGEVCAKELAKAGAKISICDLVQEGVDRVVKDVVNAGGEAIGIVGNVADEKDQERFFKETIDAYGKLNILIPSAGIIRDGTVVTTDKETGKVVKKMPLEQWQSVIDVNLTGTFISVRDAIEVMVKFIRLLAPGVD